jgi:hypothetical protein
MSRLQAIANSHERTPVALRSFISSICQETGVCQYIVGHLATMGSVVPVPVRDDLWQRVSTPKDRLAAEQKLNSWLVKTTDGIFARTNRRISIPISRQLIKFPITPNMVSIFTLGVGVASDYYSPMVVTRTLCSAHSCVCSQASSTGAMGRSLA